MKKPTSVTPLPAGVMAPRLVAVIDIGASGMRLRIAEIGADGAVRTLESLQHAVHLGKDTFTTRRIQTSTVEECVKILKGFRNIMAEYGVTRPDQIRAGLAALRMTQNQLANALGCSAETISRWMNYATPQSREWDMILRNYFNTPSFRRSVKSGRCDAAFGARTCPRATSK